MPHLYRAVFRECSSDICALRYPDLNYDSPFLPCPLCGEPAGIIHQIDLSNNGRQSEKNYPYCKNVVCVLDNIRSVYNVGSIFRTMQGFGISTAFLCGITPNPSHKNFKKTSMGAEENIGWQSANNTFNVCKTLKNKGTMLVSLESNTSSKPLNLNKLHMNDRKIAIVVGNEITGIDPSILEMSDYIFSIPIVGRNKSYNVTVAFGIGLYAVLSKA